MNKQNINKETKKYYPTLAQTASDAGSLGPVYLNTEASNEEAKDNISRAFSTPRIVSQITTHNNQSIVLENNINSNKNTDKDTSTIWENVYLQLNLKNILTMRSVSKDFTNLSSLNWVKVYQFTPLKNTQINLNGLVNLPLSILASENMDLLIESNQELSSLFELIRKLKVNIVEKIDELDIKKITINKKNIDLVTDLFASIFTKLKCLKIGNLEDEITLPIKGAYLITLSIDRIDELSSLNFPLGLSFLDTLIIGHIENESFKLPHLPKLQTLIIGNIDGNASIGLFGIQDKLKTIEIGTISSGSSFFLTNTRIDNLENLKIQCIQSGASLDLPRVLNKKLKVEINEIQDKNTQKMLFKNFGIKTTSQKEEKDRRENCCCQ